MSQWRNHLPHGDDYGELNLLATVSHGCPLTLDDPSTLLLSSFNCTEARAWKGLPEQLETVVVLRQLIRAADGIRMFGSVPLLLLPLKRLSAATAINLGSNPCVSQDGSLGLGDFLLRFESRLSWAMCCAQQRCVQRRFCTMILGHAPLQCSVSCRCLQQTRLV